MPYLKYGGQYVLTDGSFTGYVVPALPFFSFITDASINPFDPFAVASAGILQWDLGDGSIVNANDFSHNYSLTGNKTVKMFKGTTTGAAAVTSLYISNDNIIGSLDASSLTAATQLWFDNNPGITSIINPVSTADFTSYQGHSCDLTGTLDLSGFSNLRGSLNVQQNYNLTEIINPTSAGIWTLYWVDRCDLTGTLDVSGLTALGGSFSAYTNPNLTQILNPSNSRIFSLYWVHGCDLTGTLDVSGLINLGTSLYTSNNPNLTTILLPTINRQFTHFVINDCSLNQFTIDDALAKLDTWYTSNAPTAGLTLSLQGGTNMPPTDGSSNANILSLESAFSGAGQSLALTYNT